MYTPMEYSYTFALDAKLSVHFSAPSCEWMAQKDDCVVQCTAPLTQSGDPGRWNNLMADCPAPYNNWQCVALFPDNELGY
jgi:hypothetical protein